MYAKFWKLCVDLDTRFSEPAGVENTEQSTFDKARSPVFSTGTCLDAWTASKQVTGSKGLIASMSGILINRFTAQKQPDFVQVIWN